jgi:hypothetical protein
VFARGEPEKRPQRLRTKPAPVTKLDRQCERRQRRDAPETDEPLDDIRIRRRDGELADRLVERVASAIRVEHPAVALVEHDRQRPAVEPLPAKPRIVRPRPRSRVVDEAMPQQQLRKPSLPASS